MSPTYLLFIYSRNSIGRVPPLQDGSCEFKSRREYQRLQVSSKLVAPYCKKYGVDSVYENYSGLLFHRYNNGVNGVFSRMRLSELTSGFWNMKVVRTATLLIWSQSVVAIETIRGDVTEKSI